MAVRVPDEFKKACRNLGQDLDLFVKSLDDLVYTALIGITATEATAIRSFLDQLLSDRYSPDQLKSIWWSTPADLVFHDSRDVVTFLTRLREVISKPPYSLEK